MVHTILFNVLVQNRKRRGDNRNMKTNKILRAQKRRKSDAYKQTSFFDTDRAIPSESSNSISGGDSPTKRKSRNTYEENNFQAETNKGIVNAFARQISFDGIVYFTKIQLDTNSYVWAKLAQEWQRSEEAYKTRPGFPIEERGR